MSDEVLGMMRLELRMPRGWGELREEQILKWFELQAIMNDRREALFSFALYLGGLKPLGRHPGGRIVSRENADGTRDIFPLTVSDLALMVEHLRWIDTVPRMPMRPDRVYGAASRNRMFQGVPFGSFLTAENYFQGFVATGNQSLLDGLATELFPKADTGGEWWRVEALRLMALWWWMSLKDYLAAKFSHFLRPAGGEQNNGFGPQADPGRQAEESMNAQLRALTKGDVTKEEEVLRLDTWRVLAELDAQARDYENIKNQMPK